MLLNLTNHNSSNWSTSQLESAKERWGAIIDMPFPDVPPDFDESQMILLAKKVAEKAVGLQPDAVLCQGEMTMVFSLVHMFYLHGIPSYAATTSRQSEEAAKEDGTVHKQSVFRFVRFREYSLSVS